MQLCLKGSGHPRHCQERKRVLSQVTLCLILRTCLLSQIQARGKWDWLIPKEKVNAKMKFQFLWVCVWKGRPVIVNDRYSCHLDFLKICSKYSKVLCRELLNNTSLCCVHNWCRNQCILCGFRVGGILRLPMSRPSQAIPIPVTTEQLEAVGLKRKGS